MTVGTGEISGSMITVIPKIILVFTIYQPMNWPYCEILFIARGCEVQTELVRSVCVKRTRA